MALPTHGLKSLKLPSGALAPDGPPKEPSGSTSAQQAATLPPVPEEVTDELVDGINELEDEVGEDSAYAVLKPKAAREAGMSGRIRLPTQKEKDYVDFILKAGAASTHTISRLHQQSKGSTYRKLKWLKDNGYLTLTDFAYGPPLWSASEEKEVYFSPVRNLYGDQNFSMASLEHDQIVAYLAAEWVGGITDNFGFFRGRHADPLLTKVLEDGQLAKGSTKRVTTQDYARADAIRRQRLNSICLTKEIRKVVGEKRQEIKRQYAEDELVPSSNDYSRIFIEHKKLALSASTDAHFDVAEATGHAYLHPVSHAAWMAAVPITAEESYAGRAKIFEPDAVFYDSRVGRIALEVERSPKNRKEWWEKLWAYYRHNEMVAGLSINGQTGSFYYDRVVYVFTDKTTKENFVSMLREMRGAKATATNLKEKQLVEWLDTHKVLQLRDLMIPKTNWEKDGPLVNYLHEGGMLAL